MQNDQQRNRAKREREETMNKKSAKILMGIMALAVITVITALIATRLTDLNLIATGSCDIEKAVLAPLAAVAVGIAIFIKRNYLA